MAKYAMARCCLAVATAIPETAVAIGNAVQRRKLQWQREGASPKGWTPSTASQIVAVTRWAVEHNEVSLITHALRCDLQVQRLVPVDSLRAMSLYLWQGWSVD